MKQQSLAELPRELAFAEGRVSVRSGRGQLAECEPHGNGFVGAERQKPLSIFIIHEVASPIASRRHRRTHQCHEPTGHRQRRAQRYDQQRKRHAVPISTSTDANPAKYLLVNLRACKDETSEARHGSNPPPPAATNPRCRHSRFRQRIPSKWSRRRKTAAAATAWHSESASNCFNSARSSQSSSGRPRLAINGEPGWVVSQTNSRSASSPCSTAAKHDATPKRPVCAAVHR